LDYPALIERCSGLRFIVTDTARLKKKTITWSFRLDNWELEIPEGVHPPPESSIDLEKLLDVKPVKAYLILDAVQDSFHRCCKARARRVV